jgi:CelD/BcsL family acetyltransferase involved in cellulose biosynthesis
MAVNGGCKVTVHHEDTAPRLDLPASFESYLTRLTKKNRHEIRRKIRKAQKEAHLSFECLSHPSQIMNAMPRFLELFRKSTHEKREFLNQQREGFFLAMAEKFSRLGWLELFRLLFNEREAAYLFCFHYHGTLYLYNAAYDSTYAPLSPGVVAIARCIEHAIGRGIKRFDFLRGSESYKYHFGAHDHFLSTLIVHLNGEKTACTE